MSESGLLKQIRQAVNLDGRARIVRNNTGFASVEKVRFGLGNGGADLVGVLRGGRAIAIEVKTAAGRLRPDQRAWRAAFVAWGGFYAVARSVPEALAAVDRACAGAIE